MTFSHTTPRKIYPTSVYMQQKQRYGDVILGVMASHITSLAIAYLIVYSGVDQINIKAPRRWPLSPVNSPHKWAVPRKMFPFDDVMNANWLKYGLYWFSLSDGTFQPIEENGGHFADNDFKCILWNENCVV